MRTQHEFEELKSAPGGEAAAFRFVWRKTISKITTPNRINKVMKNVAYIAAVIAALSLITSNKLSAAEEKNIVKVAAGAGQFDTLVAAVKAGGLVETLSGPGPFTVFAPTDEAFAKLPKGTVDNLLKPENKDFRIDRSLDSRHLHVGNRFLAARMAGLRRWRPI